MNWTLFCYQFGVIGWASFVLMEVPRLRFWALFAIVGAVLGIVGNAL